MNGACKGLRSRHLAQDTRIYSALRLACLNRIGPARQLVKLMCHTSGDVPVHRYVGAQDLTLYQARQDLKHPVGSLMMRPAAAIISASQPPMSMS